MLLLIVGVILFLGIHSTRIFAEDFRNQGIARLGLTPWKLIYSLLSAAGLILIIYGYSQVRFVKISHFSLDILCHDKKLNLPTRQAMY
jgi:uncharacterized membrane protein